MEATAKTASECDKTFEDYKREDIERIRKLAPSMQSVTDSLIGEVFSVWSQLNFLCGWASGLPDGHLKSFVKWATYTPLEYFSHLNSHPTSKKPLVQVSDSDAQRTAPPVDQDSLISGEELAEPGAAISSQRVEVDVEAQPLFGTSGVERVEKLSSASVEESARSDSHNGKSPGSVSLTSDYVADIVVSTVLEMQDENRNDEAMPLMQAVVEHTNRQLYDLGSRLLQKLGTRG